MCIVDMPAISRVVCSSGGSIYSFMLEPVAGYKKALRTFCVLAILNPGEENCTKSKRLDDSFVISERRTEVIMTMLSKFRPPNLLYKSVNNGTTPV